MLPFVVRAEANAKNYRTAAQETVAAREAQVAAVKQQKLAEKQAKLHIEKAESIREIKRERNAAEARRRDESLDMLQAERDRYHIHSHTQTHSIFIHLFNAGPLQMQCNVAV